ncbi:MAG TPA: hypothetical protein VK735_44950 [Pseudonocardia sp.]|uniref:hypothetical protein n=1 Tax=Pseudonocardia sp. TaxID=60912 RepID=UPI002BAFDF67|nr:hypothetical protein [Pseudonocardia sp.]HTF54636.1 hypothetical protein [Pseudonocardia sp.]
MAGRHHDDDGDGFADQSDTQSRAFRGMTEADRVGDAEIRAHASAVHHPPDNLNDLLAVLTLPDEYDADGWDSAALQPKTTGEARAALAARIADPNAPDNATHARAYDQLGMYDQLGEGQPF